MHTIVSSNGSGYVPPFYQQLYRILRPDENPEGIAAKDPFAKKTVLSHVNCGCKVGYKSQFISTSASLEMALHYMLEGMAKGLTGLRIGLFDVSKLPPSCLIIDLTNTVTRFAHLGNAVCNNFAKASAEVLLQCGMPIPCTVIVYAPPNGFNPFYQRQHLYRILRPDENPEGIVAKDPYAQKTVLSHINCDGSFGYKSQFISTSASLEVALHYMLEGMAKGLTGLRIGQFDVSKLPPSCLIIDLTKTVISFANLRNTVCNYFAKASAEVLLQCVVPIPCTVIYPPFRYQPLYLYRILRPDENPEGIVAKDPYAQKTVLSHINCDGSFGYKSQFISTSASLEVALHYMLEGMAKGLTGLRIGLFDVSKLPPSCLIYDLTNTVIRFAYLGNTVCNNFAKASVEVLLQCGMPIPCTVIVYAPPNGFNC